MNADCVLVACGAGREPTREEVEEISRSLAEHGFRVADREAAPADEVDAGRRHPRAGRFVRRLKRRLVGRPYAVVAIGPRAPDEDWNDIRAWADEVADLSVPLSTAKESFR
jgi:menaquinone-dependent protoporphyrinogen IX oxidase